MKRNLHRGVVLGFLLVFVSLTGCAKWYELIERRKAAEGYDEFAGMSVAQIKAFNADPANDDKIICKKEKATGTNIPERTCRWESMENRRSEEDQRLVNELVQAVVMPPGGPPQ